MSRTRGTWSRETALLMAAKGNAARQRTLQLRREHAAKLALLSSTPPYLALRVVKIRQSIERLHDRLDRCAFASQAADWALALQRLQELEAMLDGRAPAAKPARPGPRTDLPRPTFTFPTSPSNHASTSPAPTPPTPPA